MKPSQLKLTSYFIASMMPMLALAAERTIESEAGHRGFWLSFVAVQLLTFGGYMASSLPKWAGWRDADQATQYAVIAGAIAALLAGNMAYYVGVYYYSLATIGALVAAVGGGFMGEKALALYFEKFVGKGNA